MDEQGATSVVRLGRLPIPITHSPRPPFPGPTDATSLSLAGRVLRTLQLLVELLDLRVEAAFDDDVGQPELVRERLNLGPWHGG